MGSPVYGGTTVPFGRAFVVFGLHELAFFTLSEDLPNLGVGSYCRRKSQYCV